MIEFEHTLISLVFIDMVRAMFRNQKKTAPQMRWRSMPWIPPP